jgi:Gnt-I system high-affinity gluconate transporter
MPLLVLAVAVVVLLVLMTKFKLDGFIALILVAIGVGLARGMYVPDLYESMLDGIGGQLDELVLILGFGAMLGKILADSGAAQRIATSMARIFGISRIQVAMVLTAFAIGITMFYEVGFVLLIPIVFTIVRENRLPLLWVGLPMSIALSTMHSFLPPHPGPAAVAGTFNANMGLTLFYGVFIACPAAALIAFTWPRLPFVRAMNPSVPTGLITDRQFAEKDLPGFGSCLFIVLTPVVLMGTSAVATITMSEDNRYLPYLTFLGESPIALLIALLIAIRVLGPRIHGLVLAGSADSHAVEDPMGAPMEHPVEALHHLHEHSESAMTSLPGATTTSLPRGPEDLNGVRDEAAAGVTRGGSSGGGASLGRSGSGGAPGSGAADQATPGEEESVESLYAPAMRSCAEAVKPMAMILLVIAAGAALKQVLVDSGTADYIQNLTAGWGVSPIILAWSIAVLLRIALGSATVAIVTAAGIVAPLAASSGISPELMVLAVSSGSICCSHVNDPGFWLFKEYLGLSVIEAIKTRTTYTTVLAILGLAGVLIESTFIG